MRLSVAALECCRLICMHRMWPCYLCFPVLRIASSLQCIFFCIFIENAPLQGRNITCFIILVAEDAVTSAISVFPLHYLGFILYQSLNWVIEWD